MNNFVNLSSIDAQCSGVPNPPGLTAVLCVPGRAIEGSWPHLELNADGSINYADSSIDEDGNIKSLPTLRTGKDGQIAKWSEYMFPTGTAVVNCAADGDPSYQSYKPSIEFAMAGFAQDLRKEMKKHLNTGSVFIAQFKSGQFVVVGSSDDPIFIKATFAGGKTGKDKRGYTIKGDSEGMSWDLPVIPMALVQQLMINSL